MVGGNTGGDHSREDVPTASSACLAGIYSGSGNAAISLGGHDLQLLGLASSQATVVDCGGQATGGFLLSSNQTNSTVLQGASTSPVGPCISTACLQVQVAKPISSIIICRRFHGDRVQSGSGRRHQGVRRLSAAEGSRPLSQRGLAGKLSPLHTHAPLRSSCLRRDPTNPQLDKVNVLVRNVSKVPMRRQAAQCTSSPAAAPLQ